MKLKISLKNKRTGEMLLEKVAMRFEGKTENLLELMRALEAAKVECNAVANAEKLALRDCEASVFFG
jgi:hypothetical protein